jgi:hypothetical protein
LNALRLICFSCQILSLFACFWRLSLELLVSTRPVARIFCCRGKFMSSQVAHAVTQLNTSIAVDETILSDDPRIIVIRFGSKSDAMCKLQDATILRVAPRMQASRVLVRFSVCVFELSIFSGAGEGCVLFS